MPQHRHLLTLQFLVDLDGGVVKAASRGAPPSSDSQRLADDNAQRAFLRTALDDPTALWALLAYALGPLVAAEAREALPGALDTTAQVAAAALYHVGAPEDLVRAFEDAVIDDTLSDTLPLVLRAIRVLLVKADLQRVIDESSTEPPTQALS